MRTYVASMMFVGEAESLEEFAELLCRALDGDKEAQAVIEPQSPVVLSIADRE